MSAWVWSRSRVYEDEDCGLQITLVCRAHSPALPFEKLTVCYSSIEITIHRLKDWQHNE